MCVYNLSKPILKAALFDLARPPTVAVMEKYMSIRRDQKGTCS